MELSSLLSHHARYRPHATAVVFEEQRLDYRSFSLRVDRVAQMLAALGVEKSQRVATLLPNTLELLEFYWACARIGAFAVQQVIILPTFPRNAAGKTLKRELRDPYWAGRANAHGTQYHLRKMKRAKGKLKAPHPHPRPRAGLPLGSLRSAISSRFERVVSLR